MTPSNNLIVNHTQDFAITGDGSAIEWTVTKWNPIAQRDPVLLREQGWSITPGQLAQTFNYNTDFKILYSDKGLYLLYKCEDSSVTATIKEDYGALYKEDVIEVFLLPDTTLPAYFEYELSPLNYELPLMILNNKGHAMGWKPWHYDGRRKVMHEVSINRSINSESRFEWTAEFFIPFALLAPAVTETPGKGTTWRANFYRIDYDRYPVYSSWQLTRENFHDFKRFGIIQFE